MTSPTNLFRTAAIMARNAAREPESLLMLLKAIRAQDTWVLQDDPRYALMVRPELDAHIARLEAPTPALDLEPVIVGSDDKVQVSREPQNFPPVTYMGTSTGRMTGGYTPDVQNLPRQRGGARTELLAWIVAMVLACLVLTESDECSEVSMIDTVEQGQLVASVCHITEVGPTRDQVARGVCPPDPDALFASYLRGYKDATEDDEHGSPAESYVEPLDVLPSDEPMPNHMRVTPELPVGRREIAPGVYFNNRIPQTPDF